MTALRVMSGADGAFVRPTVRRIGYIDILDALGRGLEDFRSKPSHIVFIGLLYPIAGLLLGVWSAGADMLPLLFPLASGFALLGPVAALGLYEISRRREMGIDTSWRHAFAVRHSPALFSIIAASGLLFALFIAWLKSAEAIHVAYFGDAPATSLAGFATAMLTTPEGWSVMVWGDLLGLGFAVVVLAISLVTFPLLLERDVGAVAAIDTSVRATIANPGPVFAWGVIVAVSLVLGSLPFLAGLAVVLPILGHATWHLYRKLVEPAEPLPVAARRA
jgi:uncharacterized membrane protein